MNRLTEEEQIIYDWQYSRNGKFTHTLMDAISLADQDNLNKIAQGYPVHVQAYKRFAHESGWWEAVELKKNPPTKAMSLTLGDSIFIGKVEE